MGAIESSNVCELQNKNCLKPVLLCTRMDRRQDHQNMQIPETTVGIKISSRRGPQCLSVAVPLADT
jgi:hypothetical protein